MDMMTGGDLMYNLQNCDYFTEEQVRFQAACIILGLEAMHNAGVMHKDMKPENCIFDDKGYLHICDFGLARTMNEEMRFGGSPKYRAPEVLLKKKHEASVD